MTIVVGIFSPIDVFVVTNMKNKFVATFILLAAGLVFNDVASVEAKPFTKRQIRQIRQALPQLSIEGPDAVYRCHGTFSNYKEPQQCIKAREIKDLSYNICRTNLFPMACDTVSYINQAEMNAIRNEGPDNAMRAIGGGPSLGGGPVDNAIRSLGD
jgi:hypothetical protein